MERFWGVHGASRKRPSFLSSIIFVETNVENLHFRDLCVFVLDFFPFEISYHFVHHAFDLTFCGSFFCMIFIFCCVVLTAPRWNLHFLGLDQTKCSSVDGSCIVVFSLVSGGRLWGSAKENADLP